MKFSGNFNEGGGRGGDGVEHCVLLHKVEKNATTYLDFSCQIKYVMMENKVVSK